MISTLRVLTVGSKREHIHGLLACCCVAAKRWKANSLATEGSAGDKDVLRYGKERTLRRWYREVVERGGLAKAHDLPGCFIMLPSSMYIWDTIRERVTIELGRVGVKPCYFPLFVPSRPVPSAVSSAGCLPGLVTKAGESTLNEPVALRVSSDEVAEACLSEWIRSHRDLPLKLSHWGNSIRFNSRWRHLPFLKCREVLQQEGYAAHKCLEEVSPKHRHRCQGAGRSLVPSPVPP
ncbi:hypothetical protein FOZ63_030859 [Perkinsus olseni]|uniref:Uncharacterized protein n=1 Tax=Perkinsus olseni TaxID=32597 RepID=A0A7J6R8E7_PEROL|nr:hypothetical protein FOZ63_030859 [Perkinsus olseni]